jgi:hypothetical protein
MAEQWLVIDADIHPVLVTGASSIFFRNPGERAMWAAIAVRACWAIGIRTG